MSGNASGIASTRLDRERGAGEVGSVFGGDLHGSALGLRLAIYSTGRRLVMHARPSPPGTKAALSLERQAHWPAGRDGALDRDRRFEIDARLGRRGVDGRLAGSEVIEPGAGLVAERSPEIADRPVARGVAAEERHLDGVIGHVGVGDALLGKQEMVHVIVVDDHGAFGAQQLDPVGLAERRIARRQRVAHPEIDHGAVGERHDRPGDVVGAEARRLEDAVLAARHHLDRAGCLRGTST